MAPPQFMCFMSILQHTWTALLDVGRTALASCLSLNIGIRHLQVRVSNVRQYISCRGHHYGETWPRSSPSSTRAPEPEPEAGLPRWEASTLAKSYSNRELMLLRTWARDILFIFVTAFESPSSMNAKTIFHCTNSLELCSQASTVYLNKIHICRFCTF